MRCIQRNVRAFLQVRDWPWWRLLVRVTPLLNVHRTEEQLKLAVDELQLLKTKMEKLESDRNSLKTENSKLEGKVRIELIFICLFNIYHRAKSLSSYIIFIFQLTLYLHRNGSLQSHSQFMIYSLMDSAIKLLI